MGTQPLWQSMTTSLTRMRSFKTVLWWVTMQFWHLIWIAGKTKWEKHRETKFQTLGVLIFLGRTVYRITMVYPWYTPFLDKSANNQFQHPKSFHPLTSQRQQQGRHPGRQRFRGLEDHRGKATEEAKADLAKRCENRYVFRPLKWRKGVVGGAVGWEMKEIDY